MERHMVRAPMHKHFDLERKTTKQAEARLSQSLQRLEDLCRYNMKLLAREQRQLQKELQRLQQADIIRKKFSSYLANGIQERREDVLVFSPQGGQKHRASQPHKFIALATNMPQEKYKTKFEMPPFHPTGLKDHMRRKGQSLSQNYKTTCFTEEKLQAQEKDSINPPKGTDSNKSTSILGQDQEVSTSIRGHPGSTSADESGTQCVDEIRSTEANLQSDQDTVKEIPPNPKECASVGDVKAEATKSTYLELFAKARNARYLRHRVPPESERLLSTEEIFGHEKSLPYKEEKECENRLTT
ncbi:coiled-coil domain-containing protein 190 [Orycteropus afer afer]|uniref:Coiled-coil domain-containing protein 190 n=1 Tax=Orycteropus afer afer TaxID=1230840 RepID=A0A8B6ZLL5_ORYAF|nr:coiled-coil domain-containing protein 190 [Orycteropus afer afer]